MWKNDGLQCYQTVGLKTIRMFKSSVNGNGGHLTPGAVTRGRWESSRRLWWRFNPVSVLLPLLCCLPYWTGKCGSPEDGVRVCPLTCPGVVGTDRDRAGLLDWAWGRTQHHCMPLCWNTCEYRTVAPSRRWFLRYGQLASSVLIWLKFAFIWMLNDSILLKRIWCVFYSY